MQYCVVSKMFVTFKLSYLHHFESIVIFRVFFFAVLCMQIELLWLKNCDERLTPSLFVLFLQNGSIFTETNRKYQNSFYRWNDAFNFYIIRSCHGVSYNTPLIMLCRFGEMYTIFLFYFLFLFGDMFSLFGLVKYIYYFDVTSAVRIILLK